MTDLEILQEMRKSYGFWRNVFSSPIETHRGFCFCLALLLPSYSSGQVDRIMKFLYIHSNAPTPYAEGYYTTHWWEAGKIGPRRRTLNSAIREMKRRKLDTIKF